MPVPYPSLARPKVPVRPAAAPLRAVGVALLAAALAAAAGGCSKADLSSPKAAAKTFAVALMSGDVETAMKASAGAEPKLVQAMGTTFGNFKALRDSAVAKFGPEGKSLGKAPWFMGDSVDDPDKAFDEGTEVITGDTATVTPKGGKAMKLKKVGGAWRVDGSDLLGPADALTSGLSGGLPGGLPGGLTSAFAPLSNAANEVTGGVAAAVLEPMGKAAKDVADEITAGKYKNVAEAKTALGKRILTGG